MITPKSRALLGKPWKRHGCVVVTTGAAGPVICHGENGADGRTALAQVVLTLPDMVDLLARVAWLNDTAGEIGPGMLFSLINDARTILDTAGIEYEAQNVKWRTEGELTPPSVPRNLPPST